MVAQLVERLNELWRPIYPYLAEWIVQWCPKKPARVMELGPFSGGISEALRKLFPDSKTMCLMAEDVMAQNVGKQFAPGLRIVVGSLETLPFSALFDMIIVRGAFFFLTPEIINETFSFLELGGYSLLGGGYGPLTPPEEIAKIAKESKDLNCRLGKRWISKEELQGMVMDAGLDDCSQIIEKGGLWLLVRRIEM